MIEFNRVLQRLIEPKGGVEQADEIRRRIKTLEETMDSDEDKK